MIFAVLATANLLGTLVGAIADAVYIQTAVAAIAPFGIAGGLIMARGRRTVEADI